MTQQSLRRQPPRSSLVHRFDGDWRPAHPPVPAFASSVLAFDRAPPLAWVSPPSIAPLAALQRIAAAVRLRLARARERQELRALNDHLLKDIGLRRDDLGFKTLNPLRHRD
jgi:uncharacterized protein YjiS (DUF1127 family)